MLTATRQDDIPPEIPPKDAQTEEDLWIHHLQPELARLSTHGKQIVIDSSHEMPTEHPEVVISAIHDEISVCAQNPSLSVIAIFQQLTPFSADHV